MGEKEIYPYIQFFYGALQLREGRHNHFILVHDKSVKLHL